MLSSPTDAGADPNNALAAARIPESRAPVPLIEAVPHGPEAVQMLIGAV